MDPAGKTDILPKVTFDKLLACSSVNLIDEENDKTSTTIYILSTSIYRLLYTP